MSAPDTNIRKQKRRHGPLLVGMIAAVAIAGLAFLAWLALAPGEVATPGNQATGMTGQSAVPGVAAEDSAEGTAAGGYARTATE